MYVDEPPKDGNIPDFNISKIDICPFRAYQRSFRLFHGNFSKDIHQRSQLLCFTQNDHTGHAGFKICPFLKWTLSWTFASFAPHARKGQKPVLEPHAKVQLFLFVNTSAFSFHFWIALQRYCEKLVPARGHLGVRWLPGGNYCVGMGERKMKR